MTECCRTRFVPGGLRSSDEILRQHERIMQDTPLQAILDAMPDFVMLLNSARQIVFGNRALRELARTLGCTNVVGLRPGEVLSCRYAAAAPQGCGTSEACRECGAVQTILAALAGNEADGECRILAETASGPEAIDLRVWGTPFRWNDEDLALVVATDISDRKRRMVLERIFFHDILNTASAITSLTDLLVEGMLPVDEGLPDLRESARTLVAEIRSQRELLAAENEELAANPTDVRSREILETVASQYRSEALSSEKEIVIAPETADVIFRADESLLVRVIGNLLKNALEAAEPGESVVLSARQTGDDILLSCWNAQEIEPSVRTQIFNRSFSTKGPGRGIGTYSVKLLTEKYLKGSVWFDSTPSGGTTFTVALPRGGHD